MDQVLNNLHRSQQEKIRKNIAGKEASFLAALNAPELTQQNREDMIYLLENMLLGDLSTLDGPWLKQHVLDARKIMSCVTWSSTVPEELFRHFVLPFRINNESIDYQRMDFFSRLWPRIAGLSMEEAVLAINIYCYEQVRYVATDIRTLGPNDLLRRGIGRCGEQSSMLIALLRSVGIPSRQCYVSRWSHTESNHAWVEAWTGKDWHFLGACEPEPSLDRGWFQEAVTRACLVQTRGADASYNLEPILSRSENYSIINITARYTKVCKLKFTCKNVKNIFPVTIQISVFNGGEFFVVHTLHTDHNGESDFFEIGSGDILVEARSNVTQELGYWAIHSINEQSIQPTIIELTLSQNYLPQEKEFFFRPGRANKVTQPASEASPEFKARLQNGEIAYQSKMASFAPQAYAEAVLAQFPKLHSVEKALKEFFLGAACNAKNLALAFEQLFPLYDMHLWNLLQQIPLKDRSFITVFELQDFLQATLQYAQNYPETIWADYVLCPKVDFEPLVAHRALLRNYLGTKNYSATELLHWADTNITLQAGHNFFYYRSAQSPLATIQLRRADALSLKVFKVALLRSYGHAARLNQALLIVEWLAGDTWLRETNTHSETIKTATLKIKGLEQLTQTNQIALSVRKENNFAVLYNGGLESEASMHGEEGSLRAALANPLPPGDYRLSYGLRDNEGNVHGYVYHFTLTAGEVHELNIKLLTEHTELKILAQLNSKVTLTQLTHNFFIYLNTQKIDEPFYHIINDINSAPALRSQLCILLPKDLESELIPYFKKFDQLPVFHFIDKKTCEEIELELTTNKLWQETSYPKLFLASSKLEVLFSSCGYSRTAITNVIHSLEKYVAIKL